MATIWSYFALYYVSIKHVGNLRVQVFMFSLTLQSILFVLSLTEVQYYKVYLPNIYHIISENSEKKDNFQINVWIIS